MFGKKYRTQISRKWSYTKTKKKCSPKTEVNE